MKSAIWDGDFAVTQVFGETRYFDYGVYGLKGHNGVDVALPPGTVLRALEAGVWWTGLDLDGRGRLVGYGIYGTLTAAESGRIWLFGHCQLSLAASGEHVERGTDLALSDNTGNSSGPHLHLGLRPPGYDRANGYGGYVNPYPALRQLSTDEEEQANHVNDVNDEERRVLLDRISALETDQTLRNAVKRAFEAWIRDRQGRRVYVRKHLADELIAQAMSEA